MDRLRREAREIARLHRQLLAVLKLDEGCSAGDVEVAVVVAVVDERGGLLGGSFETLQLMPGDALVVPTKVDRESTYSYFTRQLKDWTQILYQFGIGAAAYRIIR